MVNSSWRASLGGRVNGTREPNEYSESSMLNVYILCVSTNLDHT